MVEKELRTFARSARFRTVFIMGFSFGLLVWLPVMWIAWFVLISEGKHVELFGRRHPAAGVALTVLVLLVQVGAAGIAVIARDRRDRP